MDQVFLRRLRNRRVRHALNNFIALKDYGKKYGYSRSGVIHLIFKKRVVGYKLQSKWWILDRPPVEVK